MGLKLACRKVIHQDKPGFYEVKLKEFNPVIDAEFYIRKCEDKEGFAVKEITPEIGKGVFTSRNFKKGDFLLEYEGELLSSEKGVSRLDEHVASGIGCYVFFFKNKDEKKLSIDGTYSRLKARYVNDGIGIEKNSVMKRIDVDDSPHLALFAVRDIKTGEELRYDYGEASKYLPWRKNSKITNVARFSSKFHLQSTTNTDEASYDKGSLPNLKIECEFVKTQIPLICHSNDDTAHDSSQDDNHFQADDLELHDPSSSGSSQSTNPADSSSSNGSLKSQDSSVHHEDNGSTNVHSSYIQLHGKSTDPGKSSEVLSADNNPPSLDDLDLLSTKQKILKHTERNDFKQGSLLCK
ncbi:uncharacterized protein LOC127723879 [Mytilus californianus]|uniref:uncharacterized protein LOC127723879 n=1 Tax=Mytilus californianus TaxID=6549 RepID=UPI0022458731|nr:uncharacterized protein LOC127723879 [Mytilus californianus]